MARKITDEEDAIVDISGYRKTDEAKEEKPEKSVQSKHEFRTFKEAMGDLKSDIRIGKHRHMFFNTVMIILELVLIYAVVCCLFAVLVGQLIPAIGVLIIGFTGVQHTAVTSDAWSMMAGYTAPYIFSMIVCAVGYIAVVVFCSKYINRFRKYLCERHAYYSAVRAENKAKRTKKK